ncbi:MAG: hypothetical protein QOJ97_226 [Solirubrobacteraceae bacterium]|jgi:hypothetical protein|nr:hypothetical protein [Solirubrobacteraceae bacterium]
MQTPDLHHRVDALLGLAERYLPTVVESDGSFADWNVVAPAFVALCTRTLEAAFQLPPPRHRVSAEIITRSLVDYAITFAWLAAPEDDETRSDRLRRFERDEWLSRERADKRYTTHLPKRAELYRDLIAAGKMPSGLLSDASRAHLETLKSQDGPKGMPPLIDRAIEADTVWTTEIPSLRTQPLANVYASLYASLSFATHASATVVDRLVVGDPPQLLVGFAEPLGDSQGPYGIACSLTAIVLIIASLRLGWPPLEDVYSAATGAGPPSGHVTIRRAMGSADDRDAPSAPDDTDPTPG